jgi:hypothetical protein
VYNHTNNAIVKEFFRFSGREQAAADVSTYFRSRQIERASNPEKAADKSDNPLVSIPGSPGSGKSAFLANFPNSEAYKKYVSEYHGGTSPIVSVLTFNSEMTYNETIFGVRIIYGALRSMNVITSKFKDEFMKEISVNMKGIEADAAIDILREVFGADRPVFLGVDELSKANSNTQPEEDKAIMKEISILLDACGYCDVLVSALSPLYVDKLLTGSNRAIKYVPMTALLDEKVGLVEMKRLANDLEKEAGVKVDEFKMNVVRNAFLLSSGFPRVAQEIVRNTRDGSTKIVEVLRDKNKSATSLLMDLRVILASAVKDLSIKDDAKILDCIFTSSWPRIDADFRKYLEDGSIYILSADGDMYKTAVPALQFLTVVFSAAGVDWDPRDELLVTARDLLSLLHKRKASFWWERMVDLTIAARSRKSSDLQVVLGVDSKAPSPFTFNRKKIDFITDIDAKRNVITVADDNQEGHDSRLTFASSSKRIYVQSKIKKPANPFLTVVGKMIANNLMYDYDKYRSNANLADIGMVIYIWDDLSADDAVNDSTRGTIVTAANECLKGFKKTMNIEEDKYFQLSQLVEDYISSHLSSVQVVEKRTLKTWLLPSLLPFPEILADIIAEDSAD